MQLDLDDCESIQSSLDSFEQRRQTFKASFDQFNNTKTAFQNLIDCNGNSDVRKELFMAYKAFVRDHVIEKGLLDSSEWLLRSMEAIKQDCINYKGKSSDIVVIRLLLYLLSKLFPLITVCFYDSSIINIIKFLVLKFS